MIYYVIVKDGKVVRWGSAITQETAEWQVSDGEELITSHTAIPQRPNLQTTFDVQSWSWVDNRTHQEKIEYQWAEVRQVRDALLAQTDWTQLPDVADNTKKLWTKYRQQLRDITQQSDPFAIIWPDQPK